MSVVIAIAGKARQPRLTERRHGWQEWQIGREWIYAREDHESGFLARRNGGVMDLTDACLTDLASAGPGARLFAVELQNRESVADGLRRGTLFPAAPQDGATIRIDSARAG